MSFGSGPKQSQGTSAAAARRRTAWSEASRQTVQGQQTQDEPGSGDALAGRRGLLVGQRRPHTEPQTVELCFLLSINTRPDSAAWRSAGAHRPAGEDLLPQPEDADVQAEPRITSTSDGVMEKRTFRLGLYEAGTHRAQGKKRWPAGTTSVT